MKVVTSLVLLALASAKQAPLHSTEVKIADMKADSDLGKRVLEKARRVNDNGYMNYFQNGGYYYGNNYYGNNNADNNGGDNGDNNQWKNAEWQWYANYMLLGSSWLSKYSIKFQGCFDTSEWNDDAVEIEDVRISTRHVVRFRLCPTGECYAGSSEGCRNGYGDYLIDLQSYLEAYIEAKETFNEWYEQVQYDQQWAEGEGGYNYYDENFDVQDYIACAQTNIEMEEDDYAQMYYEEMYNYDNNGQQQNNQNFQGGNYYIGPYCGEQGGAILMGMFKDDTCSIAADNYGGKQVYLEKTGYYLPFSDHSMIEFDCMSCEERGNYDQYNAYNNYNNYNQQNQNNDAQDEDNIQNFCEVAYLKSGKCEENLPKNFFNMYKQKNNKCCNYIEGIKMIRDDGTIKTTSKNSPGHFSSRGTGIFLVCLFAVAFAGLSAYVMTLKRRFERASVDLE